MGAKERTVMVLLDTDTVLLSRRIAPPYHPRPPLSADDVTVAVAPALSARSPPLLAVPPVSCESATVTAAPR